jgi:hypothetical protein
MQESQKLELQLKGLYTSPNNLSGVPPGALEVADNVVINSKSKIDSRRGQTQYGDPLTVGTGQVNKIFNYASSLITNYDNKLAYDSGSGVWVDYSGTYTDPASGYKMRSLEALKNFYFTTDEGVFKIDSISSTPRKAGVVRALGGTASLTGGSGFLLDTTAVAYRMVWGYRDANNNLVIGSPSQRVVVPNSSGGSRDVSLTFAIPSSITTEYFYQIYRSLSVTPETVEPSDELQLVIEGNPTSGEISAKSFTVLDQTPYSLMRATLYTSPSQEGIANANDEPPFALDMDIFKGSAFYANVRQKQRLTIALISVESPSLGYYVDASVGTTNASAILTGIASTADLNVGMRAVGTGIPTNATILSIDSGTQVTLTANATATGTVSVEFQDRFTIGGVNYWAGSTQTVATNTFLVDVSGTPGQNINQTALNLIEIINTSSSNTTLYAYYTSGVEDLPGQILFEERSIGGSAFSATSTNGDSFSPELPTSGTTVISENDARQNRVVISKPGLVEAVPIYTYFDIGSANFPIQRVVALRDGIFFFKTDGIYRLSGETFSNFTVSLVDNTVTLKAPESAVPFNNQVFCFTTQGICAVSDSGVQIMSVPIENVLLELSSEQYTNFATASFGVAYESARQYLFFTVTETTDEFATQAYVYNSLTDSWTRWVMNRTCGVVNSAVNKLFMAQTDSGQILIERKNYTNADYADEEYAVTISAVDSDTEITLSSVADVSVGMSIKQGDRVALIEEINGNDLVISETSGLIAGAAAVYVPIDNFIQWAPLDCENPGILKQFSEISLFFRNAAFREIDATFSTNIESSGETVMVANVSSSGWGSSSWGMFPWGSPLGGQNVLRTYVPREKQRASWLILSLRTQEAFTGFSLQGVSIVYNQMSSRFR